MALELCQRVLTLHQIEICRTDKLKFDYPPIIKNRVPKFARPSHTATILKFPELVFPFLYA